MIETTSVVFHHHKSRVIAAVFRRRPDERARHLIATWVLDDVDPHADPSVLFQALLDQRPWRSHERA